MVFDKVKHVYAVNQDRWSLFTQDWECLCREPGPSIPALRFLRA